MESTDMNIVSFETAVKLKEAGFPQPEPEVGQMWYDNGGNAYVIFYRRAYSVFAAPIDWGYGVTRKFDVKKCTFAPGPAEILLELPGHDLYFVDGGFEVNFKNHSTFSDEWYNNGNAAEACAAAWMAQKQGINA